MKPKSSNDELVERIWDKECVVQVMNRRSYYNSYDMRREELDTLWVKEPDHQNTASLAYNNGYYTGIDEIRRNYVVEREALRIEQLRLYCQVEPSTTCNDNNLGIGSGRMQTATTPLVYLADDGKTARYLGYRLGYQATGKPDGSADVFFDFGLIFCDLVKERGEWKIWHLVLEHDHTVTVGEDYSKLPVRRIFGEDPLEKEFGMPTVAKTVYNPLYGWEYLYFDMPRPYETYCERDSYGPGGNLGKPYYLRERR